MDKPAIQGWLRSDGRKGIRNVLAVVYLVAPTTPADRRRYIAERSGGFLYCVSLVGVTGARATLPATVAALVRDVQAASRNRVAGGALRGGTIAECPQRSASSESTPA